MLEKQFKSAVRWRSDIVERTMAKFSNRKASERPQILVRIPRNKLGQLNKKWNWKSMKIGKKNQCNTGKTSQKKIVDVQSDNIPYVPRLVLRLNKNNVFKNSVSEDDSSSSNGEEEEEIVPVKITHYKKDLIRKHSFATLQWTSSISDNGDIAGCGNKTAAAKQETVNPTENGKNEICNEKENTVNISHNIPSRNPEQTDLDMLGVRKPKVTVLENTMLSGPTPQYPYSTFNQSNSNASNEPNTSNEQDKGSVGKHVLPPVMLPQQQYSRIAVPLNDHSTSIQRQNSNTENEKNRKINYPNVVIETESKNDKNVENGKKMPPIRSNSIKRKQSSPTKRKSTVIDMCNAPNARASVKEKVRSGKGRSQLKLQNEINGLPHGVTNVCPNNGQQVSKANGEILAQLLSGEKKRYPEAHICPDQRPVMEPTLIQQTILMKNKEMGSNYEQNHIYNFNSPLPYHGIPGSYRTPSHIPIQNPGLNYSPRELIEDARPMLFSVNEQPGKESLIPLRRPPPSYYSQHQIVPNQPNHHIGNNPIQYHVQNIHDRAINEININTSQPVLIQPFQKQPYEKDSYLLPLVSFPFDATIKNLDLTNPRKTFEMHRPERVYSQDSGELYRHLLDNSLLAAKERGQPLTGSLSAPSSIIQPKDLETYNPDLRYIPPTPPVETKQQIVEQPRDIQELSTPNTLDSCSGIFASLSITDSDKTSEPNEMIGRVYFQCLPEELADIIVDKINEKTAKAKDDRNKANGKEKEIPGDFAEVNVSQSSSREEMKTATSNVIKQRPAITHRIENLLNSQITDEKENKTSSNQDISQDKVNNIDGVHNKNEGGVCTNETLGERPKSTGIVVEAKTVKVDVRNASTSPLPYQESMVNVDEIEDNTGKIRKSVLKDYGSSKLTDGKILPNKSLPKENQITSHNKYNEQHCNPKKPNILENQSAPDHGDHKNNTLRTDELEKNNDEEENKGNLNVEALNANLTNSNEGKNDNISFSSTSNESNIINISESHNSNDTDVVIKREIIQNEMQDLNFGPNENLETIFAKIMSNCFKVLNLIHEMQNMNASNSWRVDTVGNLFKIRQSLRGINIFMRRSRKLVVEFKSSIHHFFVFLVECLGTFRERVRKILETGYALKENYISGSEADIYRDVFIQLYDYLSNVRITDYVKLKNKMKEIWVEPKKEDDASPSHEEMISDTHQKHMVIIEEIKQRKIAEEQRNEDFKNFISHLDIDQDNSILGDDLDSDQNDQINTTSKKVQNDGDSKILNKDHGNFSIPIDIKEDLEAYRVLLNQNRSLRCQDNFKPFNQSLTENLKRKTEVIIIDSDSEEENKTTESKVMPMKKQKVNNTIEITHNIDCIIDIDDEDENEAVQNEKGCSNCKRPLEHQEMEIRKRRIAAPIENVAIKIDITDTTEVIDLSTCPIIEIPEESDIKREIKCEEEDSTTNNTKENEESPRIATSNSEENSPERLQKVSVVNIKELSSLENCESIEAIKKFLKETELEVRNIAHELLPEEDRLSVKKNSMECEEACPSVEKKTSNHNAENKLIGIATPNVKEADLINKTINQQITSTNLFHNEAKQQESKIISIQKQINNNDLDGNEKRDVQQMLISKKPENNMPLEASTLNQIFGENFLENQMSSKRKQEAVPTGNEFGDNDVQARITQKFSMQKQNKSNTILTTQENIFDQFWRNDQTTNQNSRILATVFHPNINNKIDNGEFPNFQSPKSTTETRKNSIGQEHMLNATSTKEIQNNAETKIPSPIWKQSETAKVLFTNQEYSSNLKANHLESSKVQNGGLQWKGDNLTSMGDKIAMFGYFSKQELTWNQRNPTFSKPVMNPGTNHKSTVNTVITTPMEIETNKTHEALQANVQKNRKELRQTVTKINHVPNHAKSSPAHKHQAQAVMTPIPSLQLIYNDSVNTNGFISQYIKDEIGVLSKKESLSPGEYVQEVTTLLRLPLIPKDFKDFYIFVTKQQILQFHQPITFYIFLELLNQSGLKDYHKKFTEYTKRKYEDRLNKRFKDQRQQQLRKPN